MPPAGRATSQREQREGHRTGDDCPAHRGQVGAEPAARPLSSSAPRREEEDSDERPDQTLVPPAGSTSPDVVCSAPARSAISEIITSGTGALDRISPLQIFAHDGHLTSRWR